jgi:hypothetical protein
VGASQNRDNGISFVELLLIIILVIIVVMIISSLLGPSFRQWLSEFWAQINQPNP